MTAHLVCPACGQPSQDGALCTTGKKPCTVDLERALGDVAGLVSGLAMPRRYDEHAWAPAATPGAHWCDDHSCWEVKRPVHGHPSSPYDMRRGLVAAAAVGYSLGRARLTRPSVGAQPPEDDEKLELSVKVQPLTWDEGISKAARRLHCTLATWTRTVIEERHIPSTRIVGPTCLLCTHRSCRAARVGGWPADTMPAMARWLMGHLAWLRRHPAADELVNDVASATRHLERSMDRAPEQLYAGPCTALIVDDGVERECGHDLYAGPGAVEVTCVACRATYTIEERREWLLKAAHDVIDTATAISRALTGLGSPVTPERIRQWVARGRLLSVGVLVRGKRVDPTYRVGDVQELLVADAQAAAKKAQRPGSARRSA